MYNLKTGVIISISMAEKSFTPWQGIVQLQYSNQRVDSDTDVRD